jgi:hypothetical protein
MKHSKVGQRTMVDIVRVLAGLELLALTLGFLTFTLLFHVLADWKSTAMGRHFMALMACCDLILSWSWVGLILSPGQNIRVWIALPLYGALTFVVWRQVRLLIKMQIISRNDPAKIPTPRVMQDSNDPESR